VTAPWYIFRRSGQVLIAYAGFRRNSCSVVVVVVVTAAAVIYNDNVVVVRLSF